MCTSNDILKLEGISAITYQPLKVTSSNTTYASVWFNAIDLTNIQSLEIEFTQDAGATYIELYSADGNTVISRLLAPTIENNVKKTISLASCSGECSIAVIRYTASGTTVWNKLILK